jgi:hypothetical protein
MRTIKLEINETIYEKIMAFLSLLPKDKVHIITDRKINNRKKENNSFVSFFHNSPLVDEVELNRNDEIYSSRVTF